MPVDLSGDWQLVQSEGFEEYLRSMGAPEDRIKLALTAKPSLAIKQTGENDFSVTSGLLRETQTYVVGTPFESVVDGIQVNSVASWDGDKLILTTTSKDPSYAGKEHFVTRELLDGKLVQKSYLTGGPMATRTFQKA